jgi:hypothetical protein
MGFRNRTPREGDRLIPCNTLRRREQNHRLYAAAGYVGLIPGIPDSGGDAYGKQERGGQRQGSGPLPSRPALGADTHLDSRVFERPE